MFGGYGGGWGSAYYDGDDDEEEEGDDCDRRHRPYDDATLSSSSAPPGGNFGPPQALLRSSEQGDRRPSDDRNAAEKVAASDELDALRDRLNVAPAPDPKQSQPDQGGADASASADKNFVGFLDKDGNRREYEAPAPPPDIEWSLLMPKMVKWHRAACENWKPENSSWTAEDVDGREPFLLMSAADASAESEFGSDDTANAIRETEEILRPMVISPEVSEGAKFAAPRRWTPAIERALRDRGIRLADSVVLSVEAAEPGLAEPTRCKFGVRTFHVNFRYFVAVVVGGNFADEEKREFSLDGKRMMGYYYLAMSVEQAITERCV